MDWELIKNIWKTYNNKEQQIAQRKWLEDDSRSDNFFSKVFDNYRVFYEFSWLYSRLELYILSNIESKVLIHPWK